jgi:FkbM family methyltransferase
MKPLKASFKDLVKTGLAGVNRTSEWSGLQVIPKRRTVSFRASFQRVKALGFNPATVFDIGVGYGTPELYASFKDARYFLVDPVPESSTYMQKWCRVLNASSHNIALGEADGELEVGVPSDIRGTTIFRQVEQIGALKYSVVPIRRFDSVFHLTDLITPCLVKIDVQGAELAVLKGMGSLLTSVEVVVIEVSSIVTLDGGAAVIYEVMAYMEQNGFAVYDICDFSRRPLDGALAQVDLMFVAKTSRLRADRRWGAPRLRIH